MNLMTEVNHRLFVYFPEELEYDTNKLYYCAQIIIEPIHCKLGNAPVIVYELRINQFSVYRYKFAMRPSVKL